jgi:hypothetical protein
MRSVPTTPPGLDQPEFGRCSPQIADSNESQPAIPESDRPSATSQPQIGDLVINALVRD